EVRQVEARHALATARLVAAEWGAGANAAALARRVTDETGLEITLLDSAGVPVADGMRTEAELATLPTLFTALPEVVEARREGQGVDWQSLGLTTPRLRVAVRAPNGYVRIVADTDTVRDAFQRARHNVLMSAF